MGYVHRAGLIKIRRLAAAWGTALGVALVLACATPAMAAGSYTWVAANGLASATCPQLASSGSGQYMLCGNIGGNLFTSDDYGANWTEQSGSSSQPWSGVAVSSDGSLMYAVAADNLLWKSADHGVTWTSSAVPGTSFIEKLAISADGMHIIMADSGNTGMVFKSQNGGTTWTSFTPTASASIIGLSMSGDAQHMAIAYLGDMVYTSSDYGVTWTPQTGIGTHDWTTINVSQNGQYFAAAAGDGTIVKSADYGMNWLPISIPGAQYWNGIVISNDGQTLIASQYFFDFGSLSTTGDLYRSDDGGVTWSPETGVPADSGWSPVAGSADRSRLAARAINGNQVYVGTNPAMVPAAPAQQPSGQAGQDGSAAAGIANVTTASAVSVPNTGVQPADNRLPIVIAITAAGLALGWTARRLRNVRV